MSGQGSSIGSNTRAVKPLEPGRDIGGQSSSGQTQSSGGSDTHDQRPAAGQPARRRAVADRAARADSAARASSARRARARTNICGKEFAGRHDGLSSANATGGSDFANQGRGATDEEDESSTAIRTGGRPRLLKNVLQHRLRRVPLGARRFLMRLARQHRGLALDPRRKARPREDRFDIGVGRPCRFGSTTKFR